MRPFTGLGDVHDDVLPFDGAGDHVWYGLFEPDGDFTPVDDTFLDTAVDAAV